MTDLWPFPDEPDPQGWDCALNGEWPFEYEDGGTDECEYGYRWDGSYGPVVRREVSR